MVAGRKTGLRAVLSFLGSPEDESSSLGLVGLEHLSLRLFGFFFPLLETERNFRHENFLLMAVNPRFNIIALVLVYFSTTSSPSLSFPKTYQGGGRGQGTPLMLQPRDTRSWRGGTLAILRPLLVSH